MWVWHLMGVVSKSWSPLYVFLLLKEERRTLTGSPNSLHCDTSIYSRWSMVRDQVGRSKVGRSKVGRGKVGVARWDKDVQ